jgi:chromosome segregation ATPase
MEKMTDLDHFIASINANFEGVFTEMAKLTSNVSNLTARINKLEAENISLRSEIEGIKESMDNGVNVGINAKFIRLGRSEREIKGAIYVNPQGKLYFGDKEIEMGA